jgi:predicted amino acid-binding ACT domain protein
MATPTHLLTVLTPDRRGIIAGITGVLAKAGARLLELSQTVVRDYFTIIVVIELPAGVPHEDIAGQVQAKLGKSATVTLVAYQPQARPQAAGDSYILTATGKDSPGVVPTLSEVIAQCGGNFTDFSSRVVDGQISMVAEVDLPQDVALDQLQIDLQHAVADAGLQVRLQHHRLFVATNEIAFRRI